jgi:hypothetical protein
MTLHDSADYIHWGLPFYAWSVDYVSVINGANTELTATYKAQNGTPIFTMLTIYVTATNAPVSQRITKL